MKSIFAGMLAKDPNERLTAQQIADNEWIKEKCDEWQKILDYMKGDIPIISDV